MHLHRPKVATTQKIQDPKKPTNQNSAKRSTPSRTLHAQDFYIATSKKEKSMLRWRSIGKKYS